MFIFIPAGNEVTTEVVEMPNQVCMGAMMMCTFGMAPSSLVVLPVNRVMTDQVPDANIMDHVPMVNIMPFGMCMSPSNPIVAAATAAALGVLTPMPCIPATRRRPGWRARPPFCWATNPRSTTSPN